MRNLGFRSAFIKGVNGKHQRRTIEQSELKPPKRSEKKCFHLIAKRLFGIQKCWILADSCNYVVSDAGEIGSELVGKRRKKVSCRAALRVLAREKERSG